jgi:hypothetical protein
MMNRKWQLVIAGCSCLVALLFVVAEVEARRGGGGGGRGGGGRSFSRSGPASGGSIRSHQAPSGQRGGNRSSLSDNRGSRQDNRGDMQDNRSERRSNMQENRGDRQDDIQDARKERREDWQDYGDDVRDDRRDWYNDRYRYRVGSSITYATFRSLSCTSTTVHVNGVTYYRCDNDWYSRAYSGGNVTYIVVKAPAGY